MQPGSDRAPAAISNFDRGDMSLMRLRHLVQCVQVLALVPVAHADCSVYSVSPNRAPVEGGPAVRFSLVGVFCPDINASTTPLCRIDPYPGTQQTLHDTVPFAGTITSNTTMDCVGPPPVMVAGPGLLTISLDGGKSSHVRAVHTAIIMNLCALKFSTPLMTYSQTSSIYWSAMPWSFEVQLVHH